MVVVGKACLLAQVVMTTLNKLLLEYNQTHKHKPKHESCIKTQRNITYKQNSTNNNIESVTTKLNKNKILKMYKNNAKHKIQPTNTLNKSQ